MPNERVEREGPDRTFFHTGEDYEVDYWTQVLGVSRERLLAAVNKVGNSTEAVKRELAV